MIVFLDVPGVLHPSIEIGVANEWHVYDGPKYVYATQLLEILRPYQDHTEIVLSTWGSVWPSHELAAALPSGLGELITDTLWLPGHDSDYRSALATRYGCIQMWLRRRRPGYKGPWLSISDEGSGWPDAELDRRFQGTGALATEKSRSQLAARLRKLSPSVGSKT